MDECHSLHYFVCFYSDFWVSWLCFVHSISMFEVWFIVCIWVYEYFEFIGSSYNTLGFFFISLWLNVSFFNFFGALYDMSWWISIHFLIDELSWCFGLFSYYECIDGPKFSHQSVFNPRNGIMFSQYILTIGCINHLSIILHILIMF